MLIINDCLGLGGAEHQLTLLAKYLSNEWERKIWVMDGGLNQGTLQANNILSSVRSRKWRFDISPAFDLWKLIHDWRPDIIHAWGWMSCLAAIPVCRILGIPLVNGTIRGANKPSRWIMLLGQWLGLKMADGIIANSRAGLDAWGISNQRGIVVYNGFDPERLKLLNHPKKNDKFTIVMVGRMAKEKDFRSFIDAARRVSKEGGSWSFLAIGAGPECSKLVDYARDLIERRILEFPESGLEVIPLIGSADVGVLMTTPLTYEGCSNAIMEYMACGLPVICSAGGGNSELVVEGKTGFLISPGDRNDLVEKILYLYSHQEIAQKMGDEGHQRITDSFSIEIMINKTLDFYLQLINRFYGTQ